MRSLMLRTTCTVVTCLTAACVATVRATEVVDPAPTLLVAQSIGIAPESLAMAGLNANAVTAILQRIGDASELRQTLTNQVATADAILPQITSLASQLRLDPGNTELAGSHAAAVASLESATSTINATRADMLTLALNEAEGPTRVIIERWRSTAAVEVPAEFRVLDRTPDQWRALAQALRQEGMALRRQVEVPAEVAQLLTATREEPTVVAAGQALQNSLAAIELVFETYTDDNGGE